MQSSSLLVHIRRACAHRPAAEADSVPAVRIPGQAHTGRRGRRSMGLGRPVTKAQGWPGPNLGGLTQSSEQQGRPSRGSRRTRKDLAIGWPQGGSSWLRVLFSSSSLRRTDHCPLRSSWSPHRSSWSPLRVGSSWSPLRAGSSQSSGVCCGGTCGACGGPGSSPHAQSCSSPHPQSCSSPQS